MNFKQLQYFLLTAQNGSIAAAARQLDIAQPAVSQQLANLEHELKTTLFERDFRGVSLTDSGRVFLEYARAVVLQIDQAKQQINELENHPVGLVSVGMTQSICNVLAAGLIEEVENRYPDIEIQLTTAQSGTIHRWLDSREIDIAVAYDQPCSNRTVRSVPLIRERLYAAFSNQPASRYRELAKQSTIRFAELAAYQVIVPNQRSALADILHKYEAETGITLQYKTSGGQLMATLQRVTEKDEMLIMPSSAFFHLEAKKQVYALLITEPEIEGDVQLMTAANRPQTKAVRVVQQVIENMVRRVHREQKWRGTLLHNESS
ncbi:LysR family transcriptional regulator [Chromatiaceae bacterium AAb-1]|nr:LysR family transcriptional regulator [Chromatiaceae bacterium AAb-1]